MRQIKSYLYKELENLPFGIFNIILDYSKINNIRIAIVGGYIRDLLITKIHKKRFSNFIDLDLVIEGSAVSLAKFIKKNIRNVELCLIKEFDLYNTVEINIDNLKIDIASAREETYPAPGLNPSIIDSNIEADLKRRDFSINAIAFEILDNKIHDLFDGLNHIKRKELHFLHSLSVQDDPSRVLRCAKYASRLKFDISHSSLSQAQKFINIWPWQYAKNESSIKFPPAISIRLRMELSEIFRNDDLTEIIKYLDNWNVISLVNKNIKLDSKFLRGLRWIQRLKGNTLLYLLKDSEDLKIQCDRFYINTKERTVLNDYLKFKSKLKIDFEKFKDFSPSQWTEFIESTFKDEDTIKLIICDGGLLWKQFFKWLFIYRHIQSNKSGNQLIKEGWLEGKAVGKELRRLRYEQIDKYNK